MGSEVDSAPVGLPVTGHGVPMGPKGEARIFPFNKWPKFGELFQAPGPTLNSGPIASEISAHEDPSLHVGLGPAPF